ncbi:MAG: hypothetical protein KJ779_06840 [Firmicutes bacterium]|nr:hypothetical protein [Bacillota bacterium]
MKWFYYMKITAKILSGFILVDAFKIKNVKTQGTKTKPMVSKPEQSISPSSAEPFIELAGDMDKY